MSNENDINLKNSTVGTTTTFKESDSISSVPQANFQIPHIEPIPNPDEIHTQKIQLKSEISALEKLSKSLHQKIASMSYISKGELQKLKYETSLNISSNAIIQLSDLTEKFSECLYQNNALSTEISQLQESIVRERQYRNELIDQYNKMEESLTVDPMIFDFTPLQGLSGPEIQSTRNQIAFLQTQLLSFQKQTQTLQNKNRSSSKLRTDAAFQILCSEEKKYQLSISSSQSIGHEVQSLQDQINASDQQIALLCQENSTLLQSLRTMKESIKQNEESHYNQAENSVLQIQNQVKSLFQEGNNIRININDLKVQLSSLALEIEQLKLKIPSDESISQKSSKKINMNIHNDLESDSYNESENENDLVLLEEEKLNDTLILLHKQIRNLKNQYKIEKNQIIQNQEQKKKEIQILMKQLSYLKNRIKKCEKRNKFDTSFDSHQSQDDDDDSISSNDSYPNITAILKERNESF